VGEPIWLRAAIDALQGRLRHDRLTLRLKFASTSFSPVISATSVKSELKADLAPLTKIPAEHPAWFPIREAAKFACDPSPETLALALRSIAERLRRDRAGFRLPKGIVPWPLFACGTVGIEPEMYVCMAERAQAGRLGNLADWLRAEETAVEKGINLAAATSVPDDRWPFDQDSLEQGLPIRCGQVGDLEPAPFEAFQELFAAYQALGSSRVRSQLRQFIIWFAQGRPIKDGRSGGLTVDQWEILVKDGGRLFVDLGLLTNIDQASPSHPPWVDLIDFVGRNWVFATSRESSVFLSEVLPNLVVDFPNRVGILRVLAEVVSGGFKIPRSKRYPKPDAFEDPRDKVSSIVLQLGGADLGEEEVGSLAKQSRLVIEKDRSLSAVIVKTAVRELQGSPIGVAFMKELCNYLPKEQWAEQGEATEFLLGELRSRPSQLDQPEIWNELGLPEYIRVPNGPGKEPVLP
jgi:hypothetical protein